MEPEYVYLIESSATSLRLQSGFPPQELIVPKDRLRIPIDDLIGKRLWLVLAERKEFRLAAVGWVTRAMPCEHDGYSHTVSIALDPARSVGIGAAVVLEAAFVLEAAVGAASGVGSNALGVAGPALVAHMLAVSRGRVKVAAQPQAVQVEAQYWNPCDGVEAIRSRLQGLLQSTALETIVLPAKLRESGLSAPCASILWTTRTDDEREKALLFGLLRDLDPLAPSRPVAPQVESCAIEVDTELRPIEDGSIRARAYAGRSEGRDAIATLKALERAEQVHQAAVAGLASALRAGGVCPMMSRSVDIAFESAVALELIEVKSVHASNLQSQFAGGIAQVLMYEVAVRSASSRRVRSWLVLAAPGPLSIPPEFMRLAERVAVGLRLVRMGDHSQAEFRAAARWLLERADRDGGD